MATVRKWFNLIGLALGIAGVIVVWIWSRPQPSFEPEVSMALENGNRLPNGRTAAQHNADVVATEQIYLRRSRFGLGLILMGFVLQLASELVPRDPAVFDCGPPPLGEKK
jgi:hypothetical protein